MSVINVPATEYINKLTVTLNINHTFLGELQAVLTSPTGTSVTLFQYEPYGYVGCNHGGDLDGAYVFDDAAAINYNTAISNLDNSALLAPGTYQPTSLVPTALADFIGQNAQGDWTLSINDYCGSDIGQLSSWSMTVDGSPVPLGPSDVDVTTGMIGRFMETRANLILANAPDTNRRIARLSGGSSAGAGDVMGYSATPFNLRVNTNGAAFAYSSARTGALEVMPPVSPIQSGPTLAVAQQKDETTPSAPVITLAGEQVSTLPLDFWMEAQVSRVSSTGNGTFGIVHMGADYLVSPDVLIGLGAQIDWLDFTTGAAANASVRGTGYMVGPYMTARLTDDLYLDARVAAGQAFNTISPFGTFSDDFRSTRWLATAALIGDFDLEDWTITPELRLSWFAERSDAYTDSLGNAIPALDVRTGTLRFGPTIKRSFALDGGLEVTPFAKAEGIWTFEQQNTATGFSGAPGLAQTGLRARLETGLNLTTDQAITFGGSVFYDGIGQNNYEAYGVTVRLGGSF